MTNHKISSPLFTALSLVLLASFLVEGSEGSSKHHHCLRHCHRCKEMYGKHFMQHLCKDDCIKSRGRFVPDCIDLNSIRKYLVLSD